ncbi:reverse transcriptase [Gossypium australe]|uniref:Reverse transcriptase n=1 Tax=Gossypium australe TaxID=47621 RepID=A0A5B6VYB7_9ROSI|nr:reverse transcriptase [Gossypium australe]
MKESHQGPYSLHPSSVPLGKLCSLEIPKWKWERITIDFVLGLPLSASKQNFVWVVMDRLTKLTNFMAVHFKNSSPTRYSFISCI